MSRMVETAIKYARRGWAVAPCNGKIVLTPHGSKDATTDEQTIRSWWCKWPAANIAIATGSTSGIYVVDQDDGGEETISSLGLPPTLTVTTGSGGKHYYFRAPEGGLRNSARKLGPGVDTRGEGGYVIAPPSVHPETKERYKWDLDCRELADLPLNVLEVVKPKEEIKEDAESRDYAQRPVTRGYSDKALADECDRVAHAVSGTRNHVLNAAAFSLGQLVGAGLLDETLVVSELESAASAAGLGTAEIRQTIKSGLSAGKADPRQVKDRPMPRREAAPGGTPASPSSERKPRFRSASLLDITDMLIAAGVGDVLMQDVARCLPVFTAPPPWGGAGRYPRRMADVDITRACMHLEREYGVVVGQDTMGRVLDEVAQRTEYAPVKNWLLSLRWDQTERLSTWLQTYFGVANDSDGYTSAVGRAWLISAVARALTPGCKADHVLVLQGPQGAMKSSGLRALAGADWFSDSLPDIGSKDGAMAMADAWIHELAELASMRRGEIEKVKQFLTQCDDEYRAPYGRQRIRVPRSCVMAATTNEDEWIRDSTGARRFWPVAVTKIDLGAIERDREQLWAEAAWCFLRGERWHLTREMEALARVRQDFASQSDPWGERLLRIVDGRTEVTVGDVLLGLGLPVERWTRNESTRVGIGLTKIGWRRSREHRGDGHVTVYRPPQKATLGTSKVDSLTVPLNYNSLLESHSEVAQVAQDLFRESADDLFGEA